MTSQPFTLGVAYWPRPRSAGSRPPFSWAGCDPSALRDDLAQAAELGFSAVRLELRWEEAQPAPARVGSDALRGLERGLDAAHEAGLRATVAIMSGTLAGALHLPAWATGFRDIQEALLAGGLAAPATPPILADGRYRREPPRDLYGDPDMRAAARYLLRETIGNFADHPAAVAWQMAAGLGRARRPDSARAAASWWAGLAEVARANGARRLIGVVDAADLGRADSLRPEALAAAGAELALSAAPFPPPRLTRPWEPGHLGLFHALAAGLLRADGRPAPVAVVDLGLASAAGGQSGWVEGEAFGRPATHYLASEDQQATYLADALAELRRAGAAGVWLAGYADPAPELWAAPPLDRSWPARSWGVLAPGGREKPAAAVVRAFAAGLRAGGLRRPDGPPSLPLDPERYWRDPRAGLSALLAEWRGGQDGPPDSRDHPEHL